MPEVLRGVNAGVYEDCESAVLSLLSPAPELGQQDDGQALTDVERTEAEELEGYVVTSRQRKERAGAFTGRDAIRLWQEMEHLSPDEAEAFGRDVEEGRRMMNQPPKPLAWE